MVPCCLCKVPKVFLLKVMGAWRWYAGLLGERWLRSGFFISPKVLFGLFLLLYWLRKCGRAEHSLLRRSSLSWFSWE